MASAPTTPGMEASPTQDLDNPTLSAAPGTGAGAGAGAADDSDGEDEMPDYLRLMQLTAKGKGKGKDGEVKIPKRGEKDFEPTGFGGQSKLLEQSRQAMIAAISAEHKTQPKNMSKAYWDPDVQRAVVYQLTGKLFESMGQIGRRPNGPDGKLVARNELLPEEALFMLERGSLQLFQHPPQSDGTQAGDPFTLPQAFKHLSAADQLDREKYQVYAYLKRLGYIVQRADIVDSIRAAPKKRTVHADGVIADPKRPLQLLYLWDLFLYIPRRIVQLGGDGLAVLARWIQMLVQRIGSLVSRVTAARRPGPGGSTGRPRGLLGHQTWDTYNNVFHSLQIVPSGHDMQLPRPGTRTLAADVTSGSVTTPPAWYAALEPFFYAWRPATAYRKTHPPAPEFRIAVMKASAHGVPSLWEFAHMLDAVPIPGSDAELVPSTEGMDESERAERLAYERELKQRTETQNRQAYGKQRRPPTGAASRSRPRATWWARLLTRLRVHALLRLLARLFRHAPPGCFVPNPSRQLNRSAEAPAPNPFPPLKAGRRTIVLAVVDNGITTLLRFGESEFAKWRLSGRDGPGRGSSS